MKMGNYLSKENSKMNNIGVEKVKEIKKEKYDSLFWFFYLGTSLDPEGHKVFEGEFKDGEYWNGKGKNIY